jgi:hypothetical protein
MPEDPEKIAERMDEHRDALVEELAELPQAMKRSVQPARLWRKLREVARRRPQAVAATLAGVAGWLWLRYRRSHAHR